MSKPLHSPLVTAVMVTGKTPEHQALDQVAIKSFQRQSYSRSELLIVNDGGYTSYQGPPDARIREIDPGTSGGGEPLTLGELRNTGIAEARGEWIIQWDADDFHHADRIAMQMAYRVEGACLMLRAQIRYNLLRRIGYVYTCELGIAGTILHPNDSSLRYPSLGRHEDSQFWQNHFADKHVILDNAATAGGPQLYLRTYHGKNTWDEDHVMRGCITHQKVPRGHRLTPAHRAYLDHILPLYDEVRGAD